MTKNKQVAQQPQKKQDELLVESLEKFYGVKLGEGKGQDAKDKFIKDCVDAAKHLAKEHQENNQMEQQGFEEKIGLLRQLWTDYDGGKGETPEQKAVRKALKHADIQIGVAFPDDKTFVLNAGGKEDSGNMDQPVEAIVAAANRLANPGQLG